MDQETPPPPLSDSAPTQRCATLPHNFHPGSTPLQEPSLKRDSAAPPHGSQRAKPPFLELPGEIRIMIYTWLFPQGHSAVQLLARHYGGYIDMGDCLGLLTTCRQVYDEVSSLLRSERRYVVVQPKNIIDMLNPYGELPEFSRRVAGYICPDSVFELRYDLDKGTMEKTGPPFFDVCKELRDICIDGHIVRMVVTVSISYPFQGLEQWVQNMSGYLEATESYTRVIVFILRLPQTNINGCTNIYLPAVHLFRATRELGYHSQFICKLEAVDEDEDEADVRRLTDLGAVGLHLFFFVYDLLKSSPDPVNQPIPRIWIDKDLQVSHAEIKYKDGQMVHVPYNLRYCTPYERYHKISPLISFFTGHGSPYTGHDAPELAGFTIGTIYAEDALINFAVELAELIAQNALYWGV